jgi:hypothetical protein
MRAKSLSLVSGGAHVGIYCGTYIPVSSLSMPGAMQGQGRIYIHACMMLHAWFLLRECRHRLPRVFKSRRCQRKLLPRSTKLLQLGGQPLLEPPEILIDEATGGG